MVQLFIVRGCIKKSKLSRHKPWMSLEGEKVYSYLTSVLDGGEWSASLPGRVLPPGERTPGIHWTGGWVGPRAGLDAEAGRKSSASVGGRTPVVQSVVRHYTRGCTVHRNALIGATDKNCWRNNGQTRSPNSTNFNRTAFHLPASNFKWVW
jgi:hypothetical protein